MKPTDNPRYLVPKRQVNPPTPKGSIEAPEPVQRSCRVLVQCQANRLDELDKAVTELTAALSSLHCLEDQIAVGIEPVPGGCELWRAINTNSVILGQLADRIRALTAALEV